MSSIYLSYHEHTHWSARWAVAVLKGHIQKVQWPVYRNPRLLVGSQEVLSNTVCSFVMVVSQFHIIKCFFAIMKLIWVEPTLAATDWDKFWQTAIGLTSITPPCCPATVHQTFIICSWPIIIQPTDHVTLSRKYESW